MDNNDIKNRDNHFIVAEFRRVRPAAPSLSGTFKMALTLGIATGVRLHIKNKASVNALDDNGRSPLIIAASKGHLEICRILIEADADPQLQDKSGYTALDYALAQNNIDIASVLNKNNYNDLSLSIIKSDNSLSFDTPTEDTPATTIVENCTLQTDDTTPFDLSTWVSQDEATAPSADTSVLEEVRKLDQHLSGYCPVDFDEDWSDVEIDLPELITRRRKTRNEREDQWLRDAGGLILLGLQQGAIPGYLLDTIAPERSDADDDLNIEYTSLLEIVFGEIGVRILSDADSFWETPKPDNTVEEKFAPLLADAMAFLRMLLAAKNDPLSHYLKILTGISILSRDEEAEIGRVMAECQRRACFAVARSGPALELLLDILDRIDQQERRWQDVLLDDESVGDPHAKDPKTSDDSHENAPTDDEECYRSSGAGLPEGIACRVGKIRDKILATQSGSCLWVTLAEQLAAARIHPRCMAELRLTVERAEPDQGIQHELSSALNALEMTRRRLFYHNQRMVFWQARKHCRRGLPLMDLVQEGSLGLLKATEKFDYTRGTKFSTYAVWWIRQAMLRAVGGQARLIRVPIHMVEIVNKVRRTIDEFEKQHGLPPRIEELTEFLDLDRRAIARAQNLLHEPVSLDDESAGCTIVVQGMSTTTPDPEQVVLSHEMATTIRREMSCLSPRERHIINLRFGLDNNDEHTLEEIGAMYNVTRERIRQIEAKALRKLAHPIRARTLRELL